MHNGGTYSYAGKVVPNGYGGIEIHRTTGDGKYTDKMILGFFDFVRPEGGKNVDYCDVRGCSESQVSSILDYSTNYCNVRTLICGSSDGCNVADKENGDFVVANTKYEDCKSHDSAQCKGSHVEDEAEGDAEVASI